MKNQAERAAVTAAFDNLIQASPDHQLEQLSLALADLAKVEPETYRALQGNYLLNDIFRAVREEHAQRGDRS